MTLNDELFKYIIIKGDKYILKKDVPKVIIDKIKDYQYNIKKLYGQNIEIVYLDRR